jgi:hypothetical protein
MCGSSSPRKLPPIITPSLPSALAANIDGSVRLLTDHPFFSTFSEFLDKKRQAGLLRLTTFNLSQPTVSTTGTAGLFPTAKTKVV